MVVRLRWSVLAGYLAAAAVIATAGDRDAGAWLAGASLIFYPFNRTIQKGRLPIWATATLSWGLFVPALWVAVAKPAWLSALAVVILALLAPFMKSITFPNLEARGHRA